MATSYVSFKHKGFWIHNGVAEVWLSTLVEKVEKVKDPENWLLTFTYNCRQALAAKWITGILQDFDKAIATQQRLAQFVPILLSVNFELLERAKFEETVEHRDFSASPVFLVPEITMLADLFLHPENVPIPPHIFRTDKGWSVA